MWGAEVQRMPKIFFFNEQRTGTHLEVMEDPIFPLGPKGASEGGGKKTVFSVK